MSSKKLETIVYYERFVVIQSGIRADKGQNYGDLLTEEEYLDILDTLPKENQHLPDEDPNKFIAKMGAEAVHDMLQTLRLRSVEF
jgi:DNA-directed RNA polymerase subunit beta'